MRIDFDMLHITGFLKSRESQAKQPFIPEIHLSNNFYFYNFTFVPFLPFHLFTSLLLFHFTSSLFEKSFVTFSKIVRFVL